MEYFGQSKNSALVMDEIAKLDTTEKAPFLYGSIEKRLALAAEQSKELGITLTEDEIACLEAGMISSDYIYDLFDFKRSGKQDEGLEYLFDTTGADLEVVVKECEVNPHAVWTIILDGDSECIANGFYRVNRFAYLIQEQRSAWPCSLTFHDEWEVDED